LGAFLFHWGHFYFKWGANVLVEFENVFLMGGIFVNGGIFFKLGVS